MFLLGIGVYPFLWLNTCRVTPPPHVILSHGSEVRTAIIESDVCLFWEPGMAPLAFLGAYSIAPLQQCALDIPTGPVSKPWVAKASVGFAVLCHQDRLACTAAALLSLLNVST